MSEKVGGNAFKTRTTATARAAEARALAHRQTRREHATETAEDYVEAIAALIAAGGEARAVDLARWLGVSHVTVIRTIARLQRDGYVSTKPYRSIFLTRKGARLAEESRQRHELVQRFLVSLGVPELAARKDAEGIEHHCSPETLAAFQRQLE
jgi:DtxR family manganese transport transcriptional regulator